MGRVADFDSHFDLGLTWNWKYDLVSPDGDVLASTHPDSSGVLEWPASVSGYSLARNRMAPRLAQLRGLGYRAELLPTGPASLLHPEALSSVRMSVGLGPESSRVWYEVATLLNVNAELVTEGGTKEVELDLASRSARLDVEIAERIPFAEGTLVTTVLQELMTSISPFPFSVASSEYTLPIGGMEPNRNQGEAVSRLLRAIGHELVDDEKGRVATRPVPSAADGPGERWQYGDGGILVAAATRARALRRPQGVRVEGGSLQDKLQVIDFTVYDTDPLSEGYYDGTGSPATESLSNPLIRSTPQAINAGYAYLRQLGRGPEVIEITAVPNPLIREGDLVDLEYPDTNSSGTYRVLAIPSFDFELRSPQRLLLRKVFDPEVNFTWAPTSGPSGNTEISDDFNRADQNLEHLPPASPGSPNWTELGWSWWIINQQARQWYGGGGGAYNGWSFARYNTALSSSDHEVSVDVFPTSGHPVGPHIRSDGNFNGYSAMAYTDGKIRIMKWHSGKPTTLGEASTGSNPSGGRLRLRGSGSTLTAYLNDVLVLTVENDHFHGTFAGMQGYGGSGAQAPRADNFLGAVL